MNKPNKCELSIKDGNATLTVNGEVVFSRPKNGRTVAIANALYFGYKYDFRTARGGKT